MTEMADRAEKIARSAHAGQTDKSGAEYISHPARVVSSLGDDELAVVVGWLHDVVEDTSVTLADLAEEFPLAVVAAVDAVTRRNAETPDDYYARVAANSLALRVKLADVADNADPERLGRLDSATRERLVAKYEHARAQLKRSAE